MRLDGFLALGFWDLIVSVFGNVSRISDRTGQLVNGKDKSYNKIDAMKDIDAVFFKYPIRASRSFIICV